MVLAAHTQSYLICTKITITILYRKASYPSQVILEKLQVLYNIHHFCWFFLGCFCWFVCLFCFLVGWFGFDFGWFGVFLGSFFLVLHFSFSSLWRSFQGQKQTKKAKPPPNFLLTISACIDPSWKPSQVAVCHILSLTAFLLHPYLQSVLVDLYQVLLWSLFYHVLEQIITCFLAEFTV